ncbi:MAG: hypothetical protein AAB339_10715, partial [Elusimicrobiota bacterium]
MKSIVSAFFAVSTALALALPSPAAQPSFDQGVDIQAVLGELKESAKEDRTEVQGVAAKNRTESDCVVFSFTPEEPTLSDSVLLESRVYEQRCYPTGDRGQSCHEEWVRTERRRIRMQILDRGPMLPWERDVFRVCLDGHWFDARVLDASHEYALRLPGGWGGGTIEARAGAKTAAAPDPAGIQVESFSFEAASKGFELALKDRWSSFYTGESTVLSLTLKRERAGWFDDTLLEKELSLPAAEAYRVRFSDFASEFSKPLDVKEFKVRAVTKEKFDPETKQTTELAAYPLVPLKDGLYLEAKIEPLATPAQVTAKVKLTPTSPEQRFDFTFQNFS